MLSDLELLNSSEENLNWFQENSDKIREEYANKIIAIKDKKIISSKSDLKELRRDLKIKKIDETEVLIEVISPPNEINIL